MVNFSAVHERIPKVILSDVVNDSVIFSFDGPSSPDVRLRERVDLFSARLVHSLLEVSIRQSEVEVFSFL